MAKPTIHDASKFIVTDDLDSRTIVYFLDSVLARSSDKRKTLNLRP